MINEAPVIMLIDDPYDPEKPVDREKTLRWWSEIMASRPKLRVITARIHEEDLKP